MTLIAVIIGNLIGAGIIATAIVWAERQEDRRSRRPWERK